MNSGIDSLQCIYDPECFEFRWIMYSLIGIIEK